MKRTPQNPFPRKIGPKTTVFQRQAKASAPRDDNAGRKTTPDTSGLTTNRAKAGGGAGSGGPITSAG